MKKGLKIILAAAAAVSMFPAPPAVMAAGTTIVLDPSEASPFNNGEFEGWGTSLCWWANRVGYSEELTEQAAEAFFSDSGLGLDIARYNVGGGDDPEHNHITRSDSKVPGVWSDFTLSEDGKDVSVTYDITKDQNQLNVAKAALKANPDICFEGFSNSPPYFMTNSGCSSGSVGASSDNLKADMFDDFAKYIADATALFKKEGIVFESYSPMNEPDTNYWGAESVKQEGCHFGSGASESNMIVETRKALDAAGLNDVLVAGMDETSIDTSVTNLGKLTDEAKEALGRIDTHTYRGSNRSGLKAKASAMGKNLWMSEVDDGWDGFGLANRIITDLNGMQSSAWVIWDIIDIHKDSTFVTPSGDASEANKSMDPDGSMWGVGMADHDARELKLSQKYYAFGQFTRYIKPGMTLIASSSSTLAAYDKKTGEIAIVAVNSGAQKDVTFDLSAFLSVGGSAEVIRTSGTYEGGEHWAELDPIAVTDKKLDASLKESSITTFVIKPETTVTEFEADAQSLSYKYTVPEELSAYDKYFAVYGGDGELRAVTKNKSEGKIDGNFEGCSFKLMAFDGIEPVMDDVSAMQEDLPEPPKYISLNGSTLVTIGEGEYIYTASTGDNSKVTWSVSDETVATIDENGKLTPIKAGTIDVIAASETAGKKRLTVIVTDCAKIDVSAVSGSAPWNNDAANGSAKTIDGDFTTYFDGLNAGYVTLDLGAAYDISMIAYAPRSGYEYRMIDGAFYGSDDNETWTELYTITEKPVSGKLTYLTTAELQSTGTPYRYIKYAVPSGQQSYNGKSEDYNCNISEIEVYGKAAVLTDEQKVTAAEKAAKPDDTVYGNMYLPADVDGVAVTWASDNAGVITDTGEVTRGAEDTTVKLTATYKLGGEELTKDYKVTVKAEKELDDMGAYLFVHFVGTETTADCEQIYFSVSKDGTSWETLNYGEPVLKSSIGEMGVRDPHIIRSPEGDRFFLIATDLSIYNRRDDSGRWSTCQTKGSKSIVVWESENLTDWSEARLVKVAVDDAGCTWAPESVYDDASGRYMVFWASKVGSDNYKKQRVYRSYTRDFKHFTEPKVYIEDDNDNIDTTFIKKGNTYYRFTKNESTLAVIMEKSDSLDGTFEAVSTYTLNGTAGNTVTGYEGPTAYKINGENKWCLLLDYYSKSQGYKPFMTNDISKGEFTSAASDFIFDMTYRHGTVMPITAAEYDALVKKYNQVEDAETGDLIFSLGFDDGSATPTLGKAALNGTLTYTDGYNGGKAAVLDDKDYIELSDADGEPLLKGLDTFTVSFAAKESGQSWWFYAAPNTNAQTYKSEKYTGVLDNGSTITCERYNSNNTERPNSTTASSSSDQWRHITVVHRNTTYSLYIDGVKKSTVKTDVKLSDMLGDNPIAYIGKANWGSGEYSNGAIDDFKVYNYALSDDEVKAAFDALTTTE